MRKTDNYNFNIPEDKDEYNEEHYNENFETIDAELKRLIDIVDESEVQDETN